MPSFDVDFEVYCGTCGAGLCNQSTSGRTRNRSELQVTVDVCTYCIGKAVDPLNDKIEELEQLLKEAREQIP